MENIRQEIVRLLKQRKEIDERLKKLALSISSDKTIGYKRIIREKLGLVI